MSDVPELLRLLGREILTAQAVRDGLAISPATLSRLMGQAGDGVVRLGRARATRYARTRSLPEVGWSAPLHRISDAGRPELDGHLTFLANGGTWFERPGAPGQLFAGLPPWANDMAPQGYLGRSFAARQPELRLPLRLQDWTDDHRLIAVTRRGEDCVGDLVLGTESFDRWLRLSVEDTRREDYPGLASEAGALPAGSSAGGEHPKFPAFVAGHHALVKFVPDGAPAAVQRWRDLLACEQLALNTIRTAGLPAAEAELHDIARQRFLEVRRFDRIGPRGRRGVVSLWAHSLEHYGDLDSWTAAAGRLERDGHLSAQDARRIRWLNIFGQLTANTDRHFGNITLFTTGQGLQLAPAYNVLPMAFAPNNVGVPAWMLEPAPPSSTTLNVWRDAANHAESFWAAASRDRRISEGFRALAADCRQRVAAARRRFANVV